jgi:hypothetical protein
MANNTNPTLQLAADRGDAQALADHVITGIEGNNDANGGSWADWHDAQHAIETYLLDGTVTMHDDLCAEVYVIVTQAMRAHQ